MKRDTQGLYRGGSNGGSIVSMDATIHTLIAAQHIQDRIAEATSERQARSVRRRRSWSLKARRSAVADRGRPVISPRPTTTAR